MPSRPISESAPSASNAPTAATVSPGRPWPGACIRSALRATRRNESGFGGAGGRRTYLRRPAQNTTVAMNIRTPGMPKATLGP